MIGYIKDDIRNSLSDRHLEDEMRICMNIDKDLAKFNATYYAEKWLEKYMSPDDNRVPGRRKQIMEAINIIPSSDENTEIENASYDEGFQSFLIDEEDFGVEPNDD